jgi:hypothetical protein
MAYERIKSGLESNGLLEVPDSGPYIWVVLMPCVSVLLNIIILRAGNKANERQHLDLFRKWSFA